MNMPGDEKAALFYKGFILWLNIIHTPAAVIRDMVTTVHFFYRLKNHQADAGGRQKRACIPILTMQEKKHYKDNDNSETGFQITCCMILQGV
ncbi:MAG: hypothetical protein ABIK15_03925 [Pseudomonadota bacterium]